MTARLLHWRSWTRAALLRELASWCSLGTATASEERPTPEQVREDARLALPMSKGAVRHPLHAYRRRPSSTVWHASEQCPAWPADVPYVEVIGRPGAGRGCRVCG